MGKNQTSPEGHPIQVVARRTGLSADLLRAWEKRHAAVTPARTPTGRRLYSDADVARLLLLRRALDLGRSIGQIGHLPTAELQALVSEDAAAAAEAPARRVVRARAGADTNGPAEDGNRLEAALDAIRALDQHRLEATLEDGAVALTRPALFTELLVPLMARMGDLWREGELRPAHEHMGSAVVRTFVGAMQNGHSLGADAPRIVATTPAGQLHEFGALMVTVAAAAVGWRTTYLGPNLPSEEIVAAARQLDANAVALSVVHRGTDGGLLEELRRVRRGLDPDTMLIIGGRASDTLRDIAREIGATIASDLIVMQNLLEEAAARLRR